MIQLIENKRSGAPLLDTNPRGEKNGRIRPARPGDAPARANILLNLAGVSARLVP
jgi:hypothetical protein